MEKGIKKIQLIKITIKNLKKIEYLNSPSIIKYPRLNIIGETIIISALMRNNDCWNNIFLLFKTNKDEIKNPVIVTIIPVRNEIIRELMNALIKFILRYIILKLLIKKLINIKIIGENKIKEKIIINNISNILTNLKSLCG